MWNALSSNMVYASHSIVLLLYAIQICSVDLLTQPPTHDVTYESTYSPRRSTSEQHTTEDSTFGTRVPIEFTR